LGWVGFFWFFDRLVSGLTGGGGVLGVQNPPPPEIPKAFQNRAKLNPIVKTVKNCQHPKMFGKKAVKF